MKIKLVSIPPKSGLSFSRVFTKVLNFTKGILFLSRLNPVSVFHGFPESCTDDVNDLFLSRLNPVSVFHSTDCYR